MRNYSEKLRATAVQAAYEGGRSTLGYYATGRYQIENKPDDSPVTEADRTAEQIIIRIIRNHFPDHAILGEEFGEIDGKEPYRWIIDPIDGTKSFIHHVPLYGTTIGVENRETGEVEVGVCYYPALDQMLMAQKGYGTWLNGRQVMVSAISDIHQAVLLLTDLNDLNRSRLDAFFQILRAQVKFVRTWGDCFGHRLVACGQAEIMIDPWMKIWDIAPLIPIIREAGGMIFSPQSSEVLTSPSVISCNAALYPVIQEMLTGATVKTPSQ